MPLLMRDIIFPILITSVYWINLIYGLLLSNLFMFIIISIIYVYYCKWVNANYELIFGKESIDEKLKDSSSITRYFISSVWVGHFLIFFFGAISLGVATPFIIYFSL